MAAESIAMALGLYVLVGVCLALHFVFVRAPRLDAAVAGSTRGFRLVILPGAVAIWPVLLWKWIRP